ncbi:gluconeogenesis factor YvcK family protein [uncultured Clostridium sp.]|uniref:gluconeogenesis factor YvcK family protein n=1 Tax=uncultured Clostridium sp. TaxID=59620 RepID=UPI00272DC83D|nr:gluconeogenesis factor YvcK family protein [uncultured Clostridium sp.]
MKKIVIFGGGSGLSQMLKGLKLFPIDITAVVSVSDNGGSTLRLRKDFNIPAVGDISKVLISMSNTDKDIINLMNYRFKQSKSLGNHSVKNLLLTALLEQKGNFASAIPVLAKLLDVEGRILPITEDNAELMGITEDNKKVYGETSITKTKKKIIKITYDHEVKANPEVLEAINEADLIIFSSGSLLTSIIPNIIIDDIVKAIKKSKSPKLYICNLVTQPGETDDYKVSNHIEELEKYLGKGTINIVLANNVEIPQELVKKYATEEQKDPVMLDEEILKQRKIRVIKDKMYSIEDGFLRHDTLKTAYLVFSILMETE